MNLISRLTQKQSLLTEQLIRYQQEDGSFRLCFESGTMTDAYMLLLLSHFNQEYTLQKKIAHRLLRTQSEHGYWKLHEDDLGHLSSTIEAYTALYVSGFAKKSDSSMKAAESFIVKKGGVENAHIATKTLLALHHLYPWPTLFPLPLFLVQLPKWVPFSFYRYSAYVKTHFAALLILGHTRFHVKRKHNRHIQHLYISSKHLQLRKRKRLRLSSYTKAAFQKAESYILRHIEQDGTLHSYSSATFLMMYALFALGYKKQSPIMEQALEGLKAHLYTEGEEGHIQNSPSAIWDTALIATAIQQANTDDKETLLRSSIHYILSNQQRNGGWGFSTSNSTNPDVDDTHACLRFLSPHLHLPETKRAWRDGFSWLLSDKIVMGAGLRLKKIAGPLCVCLLKMEQIPLWIHLLLI